MIDIVPQGLVHNREPAGSWRPTNWGSLPSTRSVQRPQMVNRITSSPRWVVGASARSSARDGVPA
jgi:hypothetical protein